MGLIQSFRSLAGATAVHLGFAFLAMGGWAVFANRENPWPEALKAGLVQGALSAMITFVMKRALESLQAGFLRRGQPWLALIAPPLIVCSVSLAVLVASHVAAGTPEVFLTILVPFSVAFTYACVYNTLVWKQERAKP